jgi:hypothetical protein
MEICVYLHLTGISSLEWSEWQVHLLFRSDSQAGASGWEDRNNSLLTHSPIFFYFHHHYLPPEVIKAFQVIRDPKNDAGKYYDLGIINNIYLGSL